MLLGFKTTTNKQASRYPPPCDDSWKPTAGKSSAMRIAPCGKGLFGAACLEIPQITTKSVSYTMLTPLIAVQRSAHSTCSQNALWAHRCRPIYSCAPRHAHKMTDGRIVRQRMCAIAVFFFPCHCYCCYFQFARLSPPGRQRKMKIHVSIYVAYA